MQIDEMRLYDMQFLMDWTLAQTFLAVADHGSHSAAARELGLTQPTVGRHIRALEETLDVTLFRREAKGMILSDAGAALVAPARAMAQAAAEMSIAAAGKNEALAGTVRLTASIFMSHHVLPEIMAKARATYPDIAIDLVATDTAENLLFREADIAIRMFKPTQLDVVTRHIGDIPLGLYGAKTYLDRVGRDRDIMEMDLVGYDRNEDLIRGFRAAGVDASRDDFMTRTDHQTAFWELVRAGCGLGFAQRRTAMKDPNVEEIAIDLPLPHLEVWLTANEAMRSSPRIRRIWDLLAQSLSDYCGDPGSA